MPKAIQVARLSRRFGSAVALGELSLEMPAAWIPGSELR